jgi:hypothetical protein
MPNCSAAFTRLAAFFSFLLICSSVHAFPVTWTLSGVTFVDGGTASGSFVYDADTNNVSGILNTFSISVAGGDVKTFPPITYDASNSAGFMADHGAGDFGAVFSINQPEPRRGIRIPAMSVLTDAGGTLALNAAGAGAGECYNCGPARAFAGGNLIGTAAPQITSAASVTIMRPAPIDFTVTATGAPVPVLTVSGGLPAGVTFVDNGDGTGLFSGTATATGTYPLAITASNGVSPDATQPFSLTVQDARAPAIAAPTIGGFGLFACALLLLLAARGRFGRPTGAARE